MSPRRPLSPRLLVAGVLVLLSAGGAVLVDRTVDGPAVMTTHTAVPKDEASVRPVAAGTGDSPRGTAVVVEAGSSEDVTALSTPAEDTVFLTLPTYRASVSVDVTAEEEGPAREVLDTLPGVQHVAAIMVTSTTLGGVPATIAQVTSSDFRPFTPPATANHQPLWGRIDAGDIAVTHEFGTIHEVPLGARLATGVTRPTGDAVAFRVGALATNGTPPVADAIVTVGTLPQDGGRRLLVGLEPTASTTATIEVLEAAGFIAEEIPDPRVPRSDTVIPEGGITQENVWDHLAMCESSGDWHINTGNGYYGGVQFLPESWAAVGGLGLPHEHPREEQIYRATLLWQIQGWEAWPQCARKLGLIIDPPPEPSATPAEPVRTEPPQ